MIRNLRFQKIIGPFFAISAISMGALWLLGIERESSIAFTPLPPREVVHLESFWSALPPEQNLTYRAAEGFVSELFASVPFNPMGTPDNMLATINPDKLIAAMMQSVSEVPLGSFQSVKATELRISPKDTPEHRRFYFQNLANTINRTIGAQAGSPATADAFIAGLKEDRAQFNIPLERHNNAITSLSAMPVPESLAALHKEIIDFLSATNVMIKNTAAMDTDPLRAFQAMQSVPLLAEEAKIIDQKLSAAIEREYLSMNAWEKALGINAVYALPVIDIPHIAVHAANFAADFSLEFIKNRVLTDLKNKVLELVQGAAHEHCPQIMPEEFADLCPKFVTSWTNMFGQAVTAAQVRISDEIDAVWQGGNGRGQLPDNLYFSLQGIVNPPRSFAEMTRNVTLNDCMNHPDPLMQVLCFTDVENLPGTNLARGMQRAQKVAEAKTRAAETEMTAGQGFLGTRNCVQWDEEERVCLEWMTTEPGAVTQDITTKASNVSFERILHADDWAAAVQQILIGFLDRFLDEQLNNMQNLIDGVRLDSPGLLRLEPERAREAVMPFDIIVDFTASPQTINQGESSTISWESRNAFICVMNNNATHPNGSMVVSPETTTTYTIECANQFGRRASASVTVNVRVPITITLRADPESIAPNSTTTISWSVTGVEGEFPCVASDAWSGNRPPSGSLEVSPLETSTYTLACSHAGVTRRESVRVEVTHPAP